MAIRILTDSTSDILPQEAQERGIMVVPLRVTFGEETFRDNEDITHREFYEKLAGADKLPTTSQPTPEDFLNCFEQARQQGDELICIMLSGGLSGTVQSAKIAREISGYDKIYVVDSRQAVVGIRVLVDLACVLIQQDKSAPEIAAELQSAAERVRLYTLVDTLEYLHKGGRLPASVAMVGTLLKVKPILALRDGVLSVVGKGMGGKDAMRKMLALVGDELNHDPRVPVYFGYTCGEGLCGQFQEMATQKYGLTETQIHSVGAVIGAHVGPGAAAIAYLEQE